MLLYGFMWDQCSGSYDKHITMIGESLEVIFHHTSIFILMIEPSKFYCKYWLLIVLNLKQYSRCVRIVSFVVARNMCARGASVFYSGVRLLPGACLEWWDGAYVLNKFHEKRKASSKLPRCEVVRYLTAVSLVDVLY